METERIIMQCMARTDPVPVLNKERKIECKIGVEALQIFYVENGTTERSKKYTVKIQDSSVWLHFAESHKNDRFWVSGTLRGNIITSERIRKIPYL